MKQTHKPVKIFCIRRQWWTALLTVFAVICIFTVINHPKVVGAAATTRQLPIYSVDRGNEKLISISFDSAWGNVSLRPGSFKRLSVQKSIET